MTNRDYNHKENNLNHRYIIDNHDVGKDYSKKPKCRLQYQSHQECFIMTPIPQQMSHSWLQRRCNSHADSDNDDENDDLYGISDNYNVDDNENLFRHSNNDNNDDDQVDSK